ncbi:proteasome subunit alpha type-5-like isoform X2 [Trifolium pratense]|uniref:proteasome subunit alpha type-5-like isoform X2 n=1 Tax=Trifolium pratense TaxID=57577 RepID=UPI0008449353|nr:proteasome subunit alpha type-5-like isoform X2 [Trifolium pratense]
MLVRLLSMHGLKLRYCTEPSGTFWQCKAKAIGSGSEGADSSLQEQYNKDLTLSLVITKISKLVTTLNPLLDWSSQNSQIR